MADLEKLAADVNALPLPDRLQLAALLIERDCPKLARTIAERVVFRGIFMSVRTPTASTWNIVMTPASILRDLGAGIDALWGDDRLNVAMREDRRSGEADAIRSYFRFDR